VTPLPAADPRLVGETVAALPARLRGRLDAAAAAAASWQVEAGRVVLPGEVEVALLPDDGVLRTAAHVVCTCLLAPVCLHRAAVLVAAPVADAAAAEPVAEAAGIAVDAWTPGQLAAARAVQDAANRLLEGGTPAAGAAVQSQLLLALHLARLQGLHRLAAAATRVVTGVRALREEQPAASLPRLCDDLLGVLETAHAIASGADVATWRGTARSTYRDVGGLRLTGLCLEAVVSDAGYAGVVVWLLDADGRTWSVSDVKPGGPERVRAAAAGPVAVGESGLTHAALSRAGLLLSGATANDDRRLGAGSRVRAVAAPGTPWTAEPLRARFGTASAAPLQLLDLVVCGSTDDALVAVDPAGTALRLVPPGRDTVGRDNLRLLARAPGLRLLAVARPAGRHRTVELLAVGGGDLHLPEAWGGHADVGVDRLSPAHLRPGQEPPPLPDLHEPPDPLVALRRRWQRVVAGGRRTLTVPGVAAALAAEGHALRRDQLGAGRRPSRPWRRRRRWASATPSGGSRATAGPSSGRPGWRPGATCGRWTRCWGGSSGRDP
jgi:hypothetical protein